MWGAGTAEHPSGCTSVSRGAAWQPRLCHVCCAGWRHLSLQKCHTPWARSICSLRVGTVLFSRDMTARPGRGVNVPRPNFKGMTLSAIIVITRMLRNTQACYRIAVVLSNNKLHIGWRAHTHVMTQRWGTPVEGLSGQGLAARAYLSAPVRSGAAGDIGATPAPGVGHIPGDGLWLGPGCGPAGGLQHCRGQGCAWGRR